MKVSELTNEQLDYWTAKAQKYSPADLDLLYDRIYHPPTDMAQAMELVIKFKLKLFFLESENKWVCKKLHTEYDIYHIDNILMRAICRAVIASVYGEEVPDERK